MSRCPPFTHRPANRVLTWPNSNTDTVSATTYSAAGQAITLGVQIVSGSNPLYYLHSDHLGSNSVMSDGNGVPVPGSSV